MTQYDLNLRDYWRIIRKRKSVIAVITAAIVVFSYGFARFKEPQPLYKAGSAIKIENRSKMSGGFWIPQEDITTHAYTITSFPVILVAVQKMGVLPRDLTMNDVRASKAHFSTIQGMKSKVSAEQEPGTNIINITVIDRDAEEAAAIANALAAAYQEYDIAQGNKKLNETRTFIEQQMALTESKMKQAETDLQRFKEENSIFSIDTQTQELLRLYSEARKDLDAVREERKWIEKTQSLFGADTFESYETIAEIVFPGGREDAMFPTLQQRFEALRLERRELLLQFTPEHPQVKAVEGKIRTVIDEAGNQLQTRKDYLIKQEEKLAEREQDLLAQSNRLPENAQTLAKLQRSVDLADKLYSQLQEKQQNLLIQESGTMADVSIVKPALIPSGPFNIPSKLMIVFTGLLLGLIVGFVGAFGLEAFDTSMGTIEDLESLLKVPVLGVIPSMFLERKEARPDTDTGEEENADLITHYDPKSLAAEAFRTLRTNLQFLNIEKKIKSFIVTSSYLQEGKTLNCVNLAVSLSQNGQKVLLVEADLRRSSLHKVFGLNREPGLTDYVLGNCRIEEITSTISDMMVGELEIDDVLKTPGLDNLHVVTAGTKVDNPGEILNSEQFKTFIQTVYPYYDFIIVDVPPTLPVADASQVATLVDGVIIVYTAGRIARNVLKRAKDTLVAVRANVVGVILNSVRPEIGPEYLKYHSKYYYSENQEPNDRNHQTATGMGQIGSLISLVSQNKAAVAAITLVILLLLISLFWNMS
ncbi:MAG: AAA family ATPase [Thermodesulfobacteriota bacterium]